MRKIIFLDFDGVLNTGSWFRQLKPADRYDEYGTVFDPNAVANLARVIEVTGADVVYLHHGRKWDYSQCWKCGRTGTFLAKYLTSHQPI